MYVIKIKVNGDGTLTANDSVIKLGTQLEKRRATLFFDIDESIEGSYQYVKFKHDKATYLSRVSSSDKTLIIPESVLRYEGRWFISFVSSNSSISGTTLYGNYAFISEPYEAVVMKGIFTDYVESEEAITLAGLISSSLSKLVIPTNVKTIGSRFLSNYPNPIDVYIHADVDSIGSYAFSDANIRNIEFEENARLSSIYDYAFMRVVGLYDITIPKNVTYWGKYAFQNSSVQTIVFEEGSRITSFQSYSFYYLSIDGLEFPNGCEGFSGTGQTISYCENLEVLILPSSFNRVIQAYHIRDVNNLVNIVLGDNWNVSANFSNCTALPRDVLVRMIKKLKDLTGETAKTLTLGDINLAKLSAADIQIATSKNWTIA